VNEKLLTRMLRSKEPWARAASTRVLCYWRDRVQNPLALLKVQANDEHPAVRLEAVRAASFFKTPEAAAVALESVNRPQDRFLQYTFDQTMTTLKAFVKIDTAAARATGPTPAEPRPADAPGRDVQVVKIGTIPEQMLFDLKWFAVEAGKSVQIQLTNPDAMPHNLVLTMPGSLREIGAASMTMTPPTDPAAKAYVPDSPLVLQATRLVQRDEVDRLNFTAPTKPGEYVYLCTFPGHWIRMYGVMLVVPNLQAWEANPTKPTDPLTNKPYESERH
jgi:azurin